MWCSELAAHTRSAGFKPSGHAWSRSAWTVRIRSASPGARALSWMCFSICSSTFRPIHSASGEVGRDPFGDLPVVLAEDFRVEVEQVSQVFVCHVPDPTAGLPLRHTLLRMKADAALAALFRQRLLGLRMS